MIGKVKPAGETGPWMAEALWSEALALARYQDARGEQVLAAARWLRQLAERDGRDALEVINRALGNDAIAPPGEMLTVAPDPMLVPALRSIVQARLRHFDAASSPPNGPRVLFPGWSDFHLYARFAAVPIAREMLMGGDGDRAAQDAIDNLATASLLVAYAIDAPRVFRHDRRVLVPGHFLARSGASPADLAAARANAALRGAYIALARRAVELLQAAQPALRRLPAGPRRRLALVLHQLTARLARRLMRRDAQASRLGVTTLDRWLCKLAL